LVVSSAFKELDQVLVARRLVRLLLVLADDPAAVPQQFVEVAFVAPPVAPEKRAVGLLDEQVVPHLRAVEPQPDVAGDGGWNSSPPENLVRERLREGGSRGRLVNQIHRPQPGFCALERVDEAQHAVAVKLHFEASAPRRRLHVIVNFHPTVEVDHAERGVAASRSVVRGSASPPHPAERRLARGRQPATASASSDREATAASGTRTRP
jgi:hypothetical protein